MGISGLEIGQGSMHGRLTLRSRLILALIGFVAFQILPGSGQGQSKPRTAREVLAAWQDSGKVWAALPEDAQEARAKKFLSAFHVSDFQRLCREAASGDAADMPGFLALKLLVDPLPAADLSILLEDLGLGDGCHKAVVQHLGRARDSFQGDDRERLADALLKLADESGYAKGIKNQLESAAASFTSRDELLERMRSYSSSEDENVQLHGIKLMSLSADPRARDLMKEFVQRYTDRGKVPSARVLVYLGETLGSDAFEDLLSFREGLQTEEERFHVLRAMAHTRDPRVFPLLLEAYNDRSTGILNNTFALEDKAERSRHFRLWVLCRVLEPALIEALTGDDPRLQGEAVEILDRESRYGVAEDMEGVMSALNEVASTPDVGQELARRLRGIISRFERREQERVVRSQQKREQLR